MVRANERGSVKAGLDAESARKNRADAKVELRKAKKDDAMLKRRNLVCTAAEEEPSDALGGPAQVGDVPTLAHQVVEFVRQGCPNEHVDAGMASVRSLRKLLSLENVAPIDEIIQTGVVPSFVALLAHPNCTVAFEAAWCVTNIASGTSSQCQVIVDHSAVPALVNLLAHDNMDVKEQAVWALGNIAGDCSHYRDLVISVCGVQRLLEVIEVAASTSQMGPLRNATWALSNLMRGKPAPARDLIAPAVPTLARLLCVDDDELLVDTCWALSYLSEADNAHIDTVTAAGCVPRMMQRLSNGSDKIATPALRALCNILTGSDEATQTVVDAGFLSVVPRLLASHKSRTRKEACWALSNIAAGTPLQVEALMASNLVVNVVERLSKDEYEVKKEALWTIANIMHGYKTQPNGHTATRCQTLVTYGCIPAMTAMLDVNDTAVQKLVLDAIGNLLSAGEEIGKITGKGNNPFLLPFDEAEGIDKLEKMQEHDNTEVYEKVVDILERFFGEDEDEDENLAPNAANGAFVFGMPQGGNAVAAPQMGFAF